MANVNMDTIVLNAVNEVHSAVGELRGEVDSAVGKLSAQVKGIRVRDNTLARPGLGLFSSGREFWATLAKAWRGHPEARKLMFLTYPARLKAMLGQAPEEKPGSPLQQLNAAYREAMLKAPAGANEGIDSEGGVFVLPEYSEELLRTPPELAPIRSFFRSVPMQAQMLEVRALVDKNHSTSPHGGIVVYRRAEAEQMEATLAKFEWVALKVEDITGMAVATGDLLDDAESFADYLPPLFMAAIESREQADFLFGSGAGEPLGALSAKNPALLTVAKEAGQTAGTINLSNVLKMRARCWGYRSAVWISSEDNVEQFASMSIGTLPVFTPARDDGDFDRLLGRPILYTEHCPTTGTLNDLALVNGRHYLIGDHRRVRQQQSIHLHFLTNQTAFKLVKRYDGQPLWRCPLTPRAGNQRSAFVNLAARA